MGICASCLGLTRHPSQDIDESDPLLDDPQTQYSGLHGGQVAPPDEEELRREREALELITAEATENMIDVLHPDTAELRHAYKHQDGVDMASDEADELETRPGDADEDEEDAAWLQALQAGGEIEVKGLQSGALVMDVRVLRDEPAPSPTMKSLKGKLPRG